MLPPRARSVSCSWPKANHRIQSLAVLYLTPLSCAKCFHAAPLRAASTMRISIPWSYRLYVAGMLFLVVCCRRRKIKSDRLLRSPAAQSGNHSYWRNRRSGRRANLRRIRKARKYWRESVCAGVVNVRKFKRASQEPNITETETPTTPATDDNREVDIDSLADGRTTESALSQEPDTPWTGGLQTPSHVASHRKKRRQNLIRLCGGRKRQRYSVEMTAMDSSMPVFLTPATMHFHMTMDQNRANERQEEQLDNHLAYEYEPRTYDISD